MLMKFYAIMVVIYGSLLFGHYNYDVFGFMLENDKTLLSFVIFAAFTVTMLRMSMFYFRVSTGDSIDRSVINKWWYIAESFMAMGMLGTLVGFIIVLNSAFADIDTSSVEAMKEVIGVIASGMGTALLTSLVGLVTSVITKMLIVSLEVHNEKLQF